MLFPYATTTRWYLGRFAARLLVCGVLAFCAMLDGLVCLGRYRRYWYYRPKHGARRNHRHSGQTRFAVKYGLFWHSGLLTIRFLHANVHGGVNI